MKMICLLCLIILGISNCENTVSIKKALNKTSIAKTESIEVTVTKNTDALSGAVSGLSLVNGSKKTVELVCDNVSTAIAANANAGTINCKPKEDISTAGTYVGQTCEVGDMIYAIKAKGSAYAASDFSVVQNNLVEMTAAEVDAICV
jgi:hypothetical protein